MYFIYFIYLIYLCVYSFKKIICVCVCLVSICSYYLICSGLTVFLPVPITNKRGLQVFTLEAQQDTQKATKHNKVTKTHLAHYPDLPLSSPCPSCPAHVLQYLHAPNPELPRCSGQQRGHRRNPVVQLLPSFCAILKMQKAENTGTKSSKRVTLPRPEEL